MAIGNGASVPARPFAIELLVDGESAGFLHGAGAGPECVVIFESLASAREYLEQHGSKDAMPVSFPPGGFTDFLTQMQQQGTTHFGLYIGDGKVKTWPIQSYLDLPPEEQD